MSEVIKPCDMCGHHHPADITCQSAKELEAARFTHQLANEAMDYSARNPLVALAHAEGWPKPEGDLLAALHQNTGIPFMCDYILSACDEGILSHLPMPLDAMSPREIMREFKAAWERRQIIAATSGTIDPKASRLATPEEHATLINCLNQHRGTAHHLGEGEGEAFQLGRDIFTTERPVYEGTKRVRPFRMTRGQWCLFRGWEVPADENPNDEGYLVEYLDGGKPNHPDFEGYISWSPAGVFENSYKPVTVAAAPQDGSKVKGYRKLSDDDIEQMNTFKAASRNFIDEIDTYRKHLGAACVEAGSEQEQQRNEALRWLAIARTDVQTACMAACRAVAKPENDC